MAPAVVTAPPTKASAVMARTDDDDGEDEVLYILQFYDNMRFEGKVLVNRCHLLGCLLVELLVSTVGESRSMKKPNEEVEAFACLCMRRNRLNEAEAFGRELDTDGPGRPLIH